MSVYLDTSCLLKLLVFEPESGDVRNAVAAADDVVVSSLARLETGAERRKRSRRAPMAGPSLPSVQNCADGFARAITLAIGVPSSD